jgi:6-hydroxycyclohex-1-ene-1-carbonyl-CoA dehydrogenase
MGKIKTIKTWRMSRPTNKETNEAGKIEYIEIEAPELKATEVMIEIAGCGVCHTDLGFFYDGVPTIEPPPLTLGHEISGVVVDGPSDWVGKEVIVPAVLPCNDCPICAAGRGNRCLAQKMPGNSIGPYGGFSSHIALPFADLCVVETREMPLSHLSVVADAVTTPYQAAMRADLKPGDNIIVTGGAGGVGSHMVQIAKALGALNVIAIDIDDARLERAKKYGADAVINCAGISPKEVKGAFKEICKERGVASNFGWKIFEVSGSKPGQDLALSLLSFTGMLVIVGFTMAKNEYMMSKLMAFDAQIIGTWGCLPKYYPEVLKLVNEGKVKLEPFIETRPLSTINEVFEEVHSKKTDKRIILMPDFDS